MKLVNFLLDVKFRFFFENTLTFKTLINIKLADIIQEMRHKRCCFLEKKYRDDADVAWVFLFGLNV